MPKILLKHKIVAGAAAVTALAGAGVAVSATKQDDREAYLNDVAKRLEVTPDKLNEALKGAYLDQLDQAVAAGRLTQAQADAIKKRVEQSGEVPLGPGFGHGPGFGPGGRGHRGGHGPGLRLASLDAAAAYLGLTEAKLREQLRAGTTLADVAKAQGKTSDGLKAAMVTDAKAELDKAVKDGKLTAARRDEIVKDLDARIADVIAGKGPRGGPGMRRGGGHRTWGPGAPPKAAPDADDDGASAEASSGGVTQQ